MEHELLDHDDDDFEVATQEALAVQTCGEPGCECKEIGLASQCCQSKEVKAAYVKADKMLVLRCALCGEPIVAIPVRTGREMMADPPTDLAVKETGTAVQ